MKTLITTLLIILYSSMYCQNLIGTSEQILIDEGFLELDESVYVTISKDLQINLLVDKGVVVVEQYIMYNNDELIEVYEMIEEYFYLVKVTDDGLHYISSLTGVTCVVEHNTFTFFFEL